MKRKSPFFEDISTIMDSLSKQLGLEKGLKISTISKLWPKIVGPRFEKTSKIFSIYENNGHDVALIAVSSASAAQELTFYKNDVLKKLHKTGKNFGFNIKDIKFSTKYWKPEINPVKTENNSLKTENLENIQVPDELLQSIKASLNEEDLLNVEMKERFLNTILQDVKAQIWMKNNNYPACKKCGIFFTPSPIERNFCPSCKYSENKKI